MACARTQLLAALQQIAPLSLAESWDNVGLLIDPAPQADYKKLLLTIDLNEAVFEEARAHQADFIVAYHPPIFSGLKRLRHDAPGEKLIVAALRAGLPVYSPHTALDAVAGGMTDWLASALGPGAVQPIVPNEQDLKAGAGRIVELEKAISLEDAVLLVKEHLGLSHLRLARSGNSGPISRFVVCPGAGGSVFEKVKEADLLITGEMRHHDVLSRVARGSHVILTEHTNSERGFLPQLAHKICKLCPGLEAIVSQLDCDPLQTV